jgi:hypothetical protein
MMDNQKAVGGLTDDELLDELVCPHNLGNRSWDEAVLRETLHRIFMMLTPQEGRQMWRRKQPKETGWYWRRRDRAGRPHIVWVGHDLSVHGVNCDSDHVEECPGEWQGPLTPEE